MTPYHPLTSTGTPPDDAAMIWPWPHNWASPVTRRPEWSTVVMKSATGAEQRQALREYPREQVTYEHLLEGDDAALAFALLREWKGRDWLVPDWTEATKTTAPAGAVLSLLRYSVPAGLALLGTEVVTLLDAEGTLEVAPSGSWPAGTTLVPLRLASLDADQTVSQITGAVSRISPTFLFSEPMQVDETVLTRVAQPSSVVTALSGVVSVEGKYGAGLKADTPQGRVTITRPGHLHVTGAHTFEFWAKVKFSEFTSLFVRAMLAPCNVLGQDPRVDFYYDAGGACRIDWAGVADVPMFEDEWCHIAVCRQENYYYDVYRNGSLHFSGYDWREDRTLSSVSLFSGVGFYGTSFPGVIDDVRMTHACRYTTDFTPSPCLVGDADPYWSDVAFLLNGEVSRWGITAGDDPRARRLPMAHNWVSGAEVTVAREVDILDPGVGLRHTRPVRDLGTTSWALSVLLDGPDDIAGFRAFLQQHRGSAVSLYAAPPGADLTVTQVTAGQARVPAARFWEIGSQPFPVLALLTPDGWKYHAVDRVLSAGVLLLAGLVSYSTGSVLAARGVHRARILGDSVEIRYHTPGAAEVSLPLVTVIQ